MVARVIGNINLTIGPRNKAASAILEVMMISGWYFSRHSTIGAAPRYVLIPFTNKGQKENSFSQKLYEGKYVTD